MISSTPNIKKLWRESGFIIFILVSVIDLIHMFVSFIRITTSGCGKRRRMVFGVSNYHST